MTGTTRAVRDLAVVPEPAAAATAERDALLAELAVIRARLRPGAGPGELVRAEAELDAAQGVPATPTRLDRLAAGFGLSPFERAVVVLAAGPELVAAVADEIEAAGGDPRPTFGLALGLLADPDWAAITPAAPLRRWRLVRLADPGSVTRSPLALDERVLHHLMGAGHVDPDVAAVSREVAAPQWLSPTLCAVADRITREWADGRPVSLSGPQPANLTAVAAAAAAAGGWRLRVLAAADLPPGPIDRDRMLRLLERESVLDGAAWAIDLTGLRGAEVSGVGRALGGLDAPYVVLEDGENAELPGGCARVSVPRLPIEERRLVLASALSSAVSVGGRRPGADEIDGAAAVFDLAIPDVAHAAREVAAGTPLWTACRGRARARFDGMARVFAPRAGFDDLVLPDAQLAQLRALVSAVRHRGLVLGEWGFGERSARGLGTAALFAGPSGTGKTLAAEVVASALDLDLVVVDLSQVVSKYIGETEKNLGRVFDAAEDGAAVLLFDEADTLFGKRTEVRDSHDRYANLEVGYLLARMESFSGLAILTTNAKSAIDQAFLRRLRVVVSFPYPDAAARKRLWHKAFPDRTPVSDVDHDKLAAIDLPGGGIAAAALTAAYLGAQEGAVCGAHVTEAARWELAKHGRTHAG